MDVYPNLGPLPNETSVNSLDVLYFNTWNIRNKLAYIKNIVESFNILCFSETQFDPIHIKVTRYTMWFCILPVYVYYRVAKFYWGSI